jgi:hypothetical protein
MLKSNPFDSGGKRKPLSNRYEPQGDLLPPDTQPENRAAGKHTPCPE